jgi:hypothetical protein
MNLKMTLVVSSVFLAGAAQAHTTAYAPQPNCNATIEQTSAIGGSFIYPGSMMLGSGPSFANTAQPARTVRKDRALSS